MKYHELQLERHKDRTRVGRGIAAGKGKTAGRGTKGQKSRAGSSRRPGFEGGQNPLMQRFPKLRGFRSHGPKVVTVYTGQLNHLSGTIDAAALAEASLISSPYDVVKLIQKGDVTKKLVVKLPRASQTAIAMIEKAGGSFTPVERFARPSTKAAKPEKA